MPSDTRTCENCKQDFNLEVDDFSFFQALKVPPPRFCAACLLAQRLSFRNERTIYKRKCDAPGHTEEMLSSYPQDSPMSVYDRDFWWSDQWDPMDHGHEYDFSEPFLEQFKALSQKVPWPTLFNWNAVNSDYCNFTTDNKNCYLVFGGDFNEDCAYSTFNFHSKDTLDTYFVDKCELCYELVDSEGCYKTAFGRYVESCTDCMFMYDCVGCTDCVGCVGLRNRSYHILNQPYSKEEYQKERARLALNSRAGLAAVKKQFEILRLSMPHRYAHIFKSANCTGDNIVNARNTKDGFDVTGPAENLNHVFTCGWDLKDSRFSNHHGHGAELIYNSIAVFSGCSRILFSFLVSTSQDVSYSWNCRGSSNLFGCVGLRDKHYCILNKQYSKEEYETMLPKIIVHMDNMPYLAPNGKKYIYGDFLPPNLSPFAYNTTIANEYFPLSRDKALAAGFGWREAEQKEYTTTIESDKLPDTMAGVADAILNEVIGCVHRGECAHHCTKAFRIIAPELSFYRRLGLPLPQLCPSCRHYARVAQRNPLQLWHRTCACKAGSHFHGVGPCPNEFETSYAPDRPEIVYCEQCYQAEIL